MSKRRTLIKTLLALTLVLFSVNSVIDAKTVHNNNNHKSWNLLIKAISAVESEHNEKAVNGKYAGILQISPGVVDDCNKICGEKRFKYSDRYNKAKSIEMFNVYQGKYNPEKHLEKALRVWNGGPSYSVSRTNGYVRRVMKKYNELKRG